MPRARSVPPEARAKYTAQIEMISSVTGLEASRAQAHFAVQTEERVSDGCTTQSFKASREIRMRATLELDNLVTLLKEKAEETLKGIEAAERIAAIKKPLTKMA